MASDTERSPEARRLAEKALLRLVRALEGRDTFFVILGGLVPEILTRGQEPAAPQHLGTTDVDIFVVFHIGVERPLAAMEQALIDSEFAPDAKQAGWRWTGRVEGVVVKLEFLCDLQNQPAEAVVHPDGCVKLTALNLRGTGFVAEDWLWEELSAEDGTGVKVRFAGLEGYLMTKGHVARERGHAKDYYDLVYTLLHNRLARPDEGIDGPVAAGSAVAKGKFGPRIDLRSATWSELEARFAGPSDIGSRGYADQALQANPESDHAQHRQDAVAAVAGFLNAIRVAGEGSPPRVRQARAYPTGWPIGGSAGTSEK